LKPEKEPVNPARATKAALVPRPLSGGLVAPSGPHLQASLLQDCIHFIVLCRGQQIPQAASVGPFLVSSCRESLKAPLRQVLSWESGVWEGTLRLI
jgi:hypothetical protein